MRFFCISVCFFLGVTLLADPPSTQPKLIDSEGKEVVLKKWKLTAGVKKVAWIPGKTSAFEMREIASTTFKDGIVTYVATDRIQSIDWDYSKETVTVAVAGLEKPLVGTTRYRDINVLSIEAEVDQGKAGVAELRYRGGVIKGGIRRIEFPGAKAPPPANMMGGTFSFVVPPDGKSKAAPTVQTVQNVQALYRVGTEEKLLPYLIFKKTLKVELANVESLSMGEHNAKDRTTECELKAKDGSTVSVTLMGVTTIEDKSAVLIGLVGDSPAGPRLFPPHTFSLFQPGVAKIEPKKEPDPPQPKKKADPMKTEPKKVDPKKAEPKKSTPKGTDSKSTEPR